MAVTIIERDEMRARDIEDDKLLWTSLRTRTDSARMAKLINETEVLKRVVIEEPAIPSLMKPCQQHHVIRPNAVLTSTRCKGRARWEATTHSGHLNIPPLEQSLHLITPGAF